MAERILLVEDEEKLARMVELELQYEGYEVEKAFDGRAGLDRALSGEFDLVLLDIMLPALSGMEVLRRLRRESAMPVIMLTARDTVVDKVSGLDMGADDYITKPFAIEELLARIRAVLRRQANELPGAPSQEEAVIAFGKFKLNLGTREMFREDEPMPLTSGEFAVLKALVSHPREPLSRDKLMNLARGREYSAMERSIDVQISRLRRMVEEDPAHPRYIQTVWGLGYVFVPDGSKA